MAKNEDGEVELVLGSKVLMGVFFLGAVLLGLSFLMGYVVGKGAAPVLTAQQAPREKNEPVAAITSPPVVEVPPSTPEPEPIKTAPQAPTDVAPKESEPVKAAPDTHKADAEKAAKEQAEKAKADKVKADRAAADKAKADKAKQDAKVEKAKADAAKAEQAKADKAKADKQAKADKAKADKAQAERAKADKAKAKVEPAKAVAQAPVPAKGRTYLQLSATGKDEAESLAARLKSQGFASSTVQIPEKPTLFRVLVGPITPADAARTRADLKAKSFAGADEAIIKGF